MTRPVLFYCPHIEGHKIEFIHHLYEGAANHLNRSFVIVVPDRVRQLSVFYDWSETDNIRFDFINSERNERLFQSTGLKKAWYLNKNLSSYIKKHNAESVFLIDVVPYLPFLVFQKAAIAGIIYHIFLYSWRASGIKRKVFDYVRQFILAKCNNIERVLVLNDELGAHCFNKRFHTNKYVFLPDPVPNEGEIEDGFILRKDFSIAEDRIVLLHAGGMLRYKGTLNILKAIEQMSVVDRNRFCFVFAGRITQEIRKEFFEIYNKIKNNSSIILIEGYLPSTRINSLFAQCDYVLIPYYPRSQSSGIIGLSALFDKPVITTGQGVVGRLVAKYKLGELIRDNSPSTILDSLSKIKDKKVIDGHRYIDSHRVKDFLQVVFSLF